MEREREDGWSALIDQLMRIRWRSIGPPHLISHRVPYFGNILYNPMRIYSFTQTLSVKLMSQRSLETLGSEEIVHAYAGPPDSLQKPH